MRLKDKVAIISGGARGMGAAEAKLFAREGAKVVIGDVLEEEGRRTEAEINETGGECLFVRLAVTSEAEWQQAVASTVARFGETGRAGKQRRNRRHGNSRRHYGGRMGPGNGGQCQRSVPGNQGCYTGDAPVRGGSIINISSQVGLVGTDTASPQYQSSKGAVRMLTKATAIQYAGEGIRVNSVHPGPIVTPMIEEGLDPETHRILLSRIPLGRYGEAENVAFGVLFLASDESSFMTGSELVIDGGYTAQ